MLKAQAVRRSPAICGTWSAMRMPRKSTATRAHDLLHVRIAVIHKGLDEARNGRADVAEMDLPELAHVREGPRRFQDILAHAAAAFHPGPTTETDADVRTVGDFQGARVTVEVAEDAAWHAA